jgi:3-deoxy-7-phosphoheptulonate synthase
VRRELPEFLAQKLKLLLLFEKLLRAVDRLAVRLRFAFFAVVLLRAVVRLAVRLNEPARRAVRRLDVRFAPARAVVRRAVARRALVRLAGVRRVVLLRAVVRRAVLLRVVVRRGVLRRAGERRLERLLRVAIVCFLAGVGWVLRLANRREGLGPPGPTSRRSHAVCGITATARIGELFLEVEHSPRNRGGCSELRLRESIRSIRLRTRPSKRTRPPLTTPNPARDWSIDSWKRRLAAQQVVYPDRAAVDRAVNRLRELPPLVTSGEVERLKGLLADAQAGQRFLLQGGDCAERIRECGSDTIASKLKILLQMSLVLARAANKPVVRVGRMAGQYAKPRSSATETRAGPDGRPLTLPSYYGDLVNDAAFDPESRRPDPERMVEGYKHAGLTLNFVRALLDAGLGDIHHPEQWDMPSLKKAGLVPQVAARYREMTRRVLDGLRLMEALGARTVDELTRADFFVSHEGLNLLYESAQTRRVPRRAGWFNLTTHLPWIGERTRAIDGAHVEYFRGIANPLGVKIGPGVTPSELVRLLDVLDPAREPGKMAVITRLGAEKVGEVLPVLVRAVTAGGRRVLWVCDPMHANSTTLASGVKTRRFERIVDEMLATYDALEAEGAHLGGVHVELTGEDVTECVGGASGVSEADLSRNYASVCDPRLNYEQALELAFALGERMERG